MSRARRGSSSRGIPAHRNPELINAAIQEGMGNLLSTHPEFAKAGDYIGEHVDQRKMGLEVQKIEEYLQEHGRDWSEEQKSRFMYEHLAEYVSSGEILDEPAKRVILNGGLEEKAEQSRSWWGGRGKRHSPESEDNIRQVTSAFRDLYHIMGSSDYAKRMPQLYEAVGNIYDLGFLSAAVDVLKSKGLLKEGKYVALKNAIKGRIQETADRSGELMSEYISPQQKKEDAEREEQGERQPHFPRRGYKERAVAAAIIGAVGLGLVLASNTRLTGNVLGTTTTNTAAGFGGLLLVIAALTLAAFNRNNEGI